MRNTFQYHSLKAVVCHNHSRLGGIALHVLHSFQCFQQMEQICRWQRWEPSDKIAGSRS